jgi:hypothetical protein
MSWIRTCDYPGFGAPTKSGYGCCYNISNAALLMTVSANAVRGRRPIERLLLVLLLLPRLYVIY